MKATAQARHSHAAGNSAGGCAVAPTCKELHRCWHQDWHQTIPAVSSRVAKASMFIGDSPSGGVAERSNAAVLKFDLGRLAGMRQRPLASGIANFRVRAGRGDCMTYVGVRADARAWLQEWLQRPVDGAALFG